MPETRTLLARRRREKVGGDPKTIDKKESVGKEEERVSSFFLASRLSSQEEIGEDRKPGRTRSFSPKESWFKAKNYGGVGAKGGRERRGEREIGSEGERE